MESYYNTFKAKVEVLEHYRGSFGSNPGLVSAAIMLKGAPVDKQDLLKFTKDHALAVLFLTHSDQSKYGMICAELENQYSRGTNQYPADLTAVYNLLLTDVRVQSTCRSLHPVYKSHIANQSEHTDQISIDKDVTFVQSTITPGNDGTTHRNVVCYKCNANGHYANQCPLAKQACEEGHKKKIEIQLLQVDQMECNVPHDFTFS